MYNAAHGRRSQLTSWIMMVVGEERMTDCVLQNNGFEIRQKQCNIQLQPWISNHWHEYGYSETKTTPVIGGTNNPHWDYLVFRTWKKITVNKIMDYDGAGRKPDQLCPTKKNNFGIWQKQCNIQLQPWNSNHWISWVPYTVSTLTQLHGLLNMSLHFIDHVKHSKYCGLIELYW